jgi:predicted TIM-barrel fold metal-dependent hydrolase
MVVFDCVVHALDVRDSAFDDPAEGKTIQGGLDGFARWTEGGPGAPQGHEDIAAGPPTADWANQKLFGESDTDLAMVQTVPLFHAFKDGMGPAEFAYQIAKSNPDRYLFCGGVDPLAQGLEVALEDMERQVEEFGAVSMKFYSAQSIDMAWFADDEKIAYPLWEKAQELGIKCVQFHKGLPLGHQRVEDLRPNDLQKAAFDFPDLNFAIHHWGDPYIDECINIAMRFENIYLVMPLWFNQYFLQPREMQHRLGKALLYVGPDKLCYGTDAFLWPNVQSYIDMFAEFQMPEDLQENYGYPAIDRETREKIFGRNYANAIGIDLDARVEKLGLTVSGD